MPDTAPVTVVPSAGFTPIVPPATSTGPLGSPIGPSAATAAYPPAIHPYTVETPAAHVPTTPYPPTSGYATTSYPPAVHPPVPTYPGPALGAPTTTDSSGPGRALGIGSLALGAFAAIGAVLPVVNIASIVIAATGAGLGIAALFHLSRSRGFALAGAIVSIVALTASVALATVYTGVATSAASGLLDDVGALPAAIDDYAEETITAADADASSGGFDDPLPLGETIVVTRDDEARWEITLGEATYDAEEEVLLGSGAADVSSDLAGEPAQFAYVSAEITYLGADSASLYEEIYVCFSTPDEVYYCAGEIASVAPGTDLSLTDEIGSGETVAGNFLVAIPAAAEDTGRWATAGEWTDFLYLTAP